MLPILLPHESGIVADRCILAAGLRTLHGAEMFKALGAAQCAEIQAAGATRRLAAGQRIFSQGDEGRTCHSLLGGRVKIVQTRPDGAQSLIRFIGPGDMYGTVAALMGRPFPADAIAVIDSVEVCWPVETMRALMARFPALGIGSMASAGVRLFDLQNRLGELAGERVEQRIARTLLRLIEQGGRETGDGIEISFPITRQEIAEMSGSTLHTVSRTLSAWDQRGLTESARRHILVRLPSELNLIANQT